MAGITLAQAEAQLNSYIAAETAVLANQSYEIAGRKFTRANLDSIRDGIQYWNNKVITLSNAVSGRGRARTVIVGG